MGKTQTISTSLFQTANFILHSGRRSNWKIDCDYLTKSDWDTLAMMAVNILPPFNSVVGIPIGGIEFCNALLKYRSDPKKHDTLLIVDDVLTTGSSFIEMKEKVFNETTNKWNQIIGCVAFSRGYHFDWVTPIFLINSKLR